MPADCTAAPEALNLTVSSTIAVGGWPSDVGEAVDRAAFAERIRAKRIAARVPYPEPSHRLLRLAIDAARKSEVAREVSDIAHAVAAQYRDADEDELDAAWLADLERHEAVLSQILAVPAPTPTVAFEKVVAFFAGQGCRLDDNGHLTGPDIGDEPLAEAFRSLARDMKSLAQASEAQLHAAVDATAPNFVDMERRWFEAMTADTEEEVKGETLPLVHGGAGHMDKVMHITPCQTLADAVIKLRVVMHETMGLFSCGEGEWHEDALSDIKGLLERTVLQSSNPPVHPDAAILNLGQEFERLWVDERRAAVAYGDEHISDEEFDAICNSTGTIARQIAALPASTLDGVKVKARVTAWGHDGVADLIKPDSNYTADWTMTALMRDLLSEPPAPVPHPDAAILEIGREFDMLAAEVEALEAEAKRIGEEIYPGGLGRSKRTAETDDAYFARLHRVERASGYDVACDRAQERACQIYALEDRLCALRATTTAGFIVKAKLAAWEHIPERHERAERRFTASLLCDLLSQAT